MATIAWLLKVGAEHVKGIFRNRIRELSTRMTHIAATMVVWIKDTCQPQKRPYSGKQIRMSAGARNAKITFLASGMHSLVSGFTVRRNSQFARRLTGTSNAH